MKVKTKSPAGESRDAKTIIASKDKLLDDKIPENLNVVLRLLDGQERIFKLTRTRTIFGRTDGDYNINDPNVSKKHMVIEIWSRDNIYVRDLSSTNGTYLNGTRIITSKLKDGDILQIGSTKLQVVIK